VDGGVREWLGGLSRRELLLVGALGVAALGGAGLWYVRSLPQPVAITAQPRAAPTAAATPTVLIVHVAGWVKAPGVYELRDGSRVIDAIEAAGGARHDADLSAVNLAAPLTDGQQVLLARTADVVASTAPVGSGTVEAATALVNLNSATAEELETLPGIGEVLAATIVQYREEHGPFTSVDQLVDVSGIGEVTLEELRDLVTV
jgi:competence protein ComEA